MKDKILEMLKTKYSNLGLSKDILDGYADYLSASITEDTGIEAGIASIEPLLKIQQKELDKVRAKAKKDEEVKKSPNDDEKKEVVKKDPQTDEKVEKDKKKDDEIPAWAKKLTEDLSTLKQKLADSDKAKVIDTRKGEISKIVAKLPASVKKAYERMNFDVSDEDYEQLKTSIESEVKDIEKDFTTKKSLFTPPFHNTGEHDKEISKDDADKIAARLVNH